MLVTEQDILAFQTCPRKHAFTQSSKYKNTPSVASLQQFMAIWMWTYQLIHGSKCTMRALKEKWATTVTKANLDATDSNAALDPIGETIATGFPLVRELYERYKSYPHKPAATMMPMRHIVPHLGAVVLHAQVITLNDLGNVVLLNYSEDSYTRDTTTNLVHQLRLATAHEQYSAVQLLNTRVTYKLPITYLRISELDSTQLASNIKHIMLAIKKGIDYPILNCRLNCPYKTECL